MEREATPNVVRKIAEVKEELNERFSVRKIGVFGSHVRGEETSESDVDIAEPTFDNYMDLKYRLEELLQRPVDLVISDTVKSRLKPIIERDVVYAWRPSSVS